MSVKSLLLNILSSLILAALSTNSFGQNFQWAKQIGGSGWDEASAIKTDQNNNVYVVGLFIGTVDFDPSPAVFNLTSVGEKDAFICKLDAAGNFLWAKQFGDSASIDEKTSFGIDSFGNLYLTNSFLGTVDFDPGAGNFSLTSLGSDRDIFIQKLDANGNFIWAKQIGAPFVPTFPTPVHSNAIAIDANGNIYLTGYFDGTVDFDPHPTLSFDMTSQYNASDIFTCKFDTDGNFVWAKQFTGTQGQGKGGVGYAIVVDGNGNTYSTGTMGGTIDFDPSPNTFLLNTSAPNHTEIYISKLDASGNLLWAKTMGPGEGSAIAIDDNNNIYSSGWTPSGYIPLISKHNSAGNLLWAKQLGGLNGNSIAIDNNGNVYTTGLCFGTNDFDPSSGVFNLTGGNSDSYISKLDSMGNFVWAGLLTGNNQVWVNSITTDMNNNIYTSGFFNETADFDPSSSSAFNLSSPAIGYDIFINKLSPPVFAGLTKNSFEAGINVYPNPTEGNLIIEFDSPHDGLQLVIRNMLGQVINTHFISDQKRIEIQINDASGLYFLEITDQKNHRSVLKIVKK